MSKILKTAAMVVGAVALVATGIGAAAGLGAFGSVAAGTMSAATAATLGTIATIGTIASVAAGALTIAAGLTAKKPTAQATGSPTQFTADPDAGIPLVVGRTGTAGNIVMRKAWDTRDAGDNDRQAFISVLSLGPVAGIDSFTSDKAPVSFSAGAALGAFAGFMWMTTQLGAMPEAAAMTFGSGAGAPPGWTAAHKLSGKAAAAWTLKFDTKGKVFQAGVPAPMWVVRGAKCYDPRKDSTYPGGSGSHRMADPADTAAYDAATDTWEFTEDPYLLGLRWAHGFWQRDRNDAGSKYQRVMGMGAPWAMIDVAAFVEGANVAQANGWKCGGVVYSGDDKWASMKKILQAGMGEPLPLGARISCLVNAPKVSLATITKDDLAGKASVATTQPRRNRLNTITPRYRLEVNNWQLLPGSPVSVPEYITLDKGKRSKTQDYPFIQDTKQVATAVRYDIENGREFGPITLPLKLVWMGYKPGDCVTVTLPEVGLNDQPVLLLNRDLEPASGVVTMTARSETAAKHPYALGQTTTPPPTPGVTGPLLVPTPGMAEWALDAPAADSGIITPTLVITGACAANVDAVVFEYREFGSGADWTNAGSDVPSVTRREIVSVKSTTQYEVAVSYVRNGVTGGRRVVGPVTTPTVSVRGDDGASVFTLVANDANTTVTPSSVTKVGGSGLDWDAGAYSVEKYVGDVMVTGRIVDAAHHQMVGLNADNSAGPGYLDIDYAAYNSAGSFLVFMRGSYVAGSGTVSDGAVLYVRRRGATVEFGVLGESAPRYVHSTGVDPTVPLGADFALCEVGAKIDNITFQPVGSDGAAGTPGLNNATVSIYRRAASAPALPTAPTTYTFATAALTGLDNGWTTSIPTGSDPLYVSKAVASATGAADTIAAAEWASPVIQAQNGADGYNSKAIFIYQRAASVPALPSGSVTYTFSAQSLTGLDNGWQATIPAGSLPIYVTTASALSTTDTDAIAPSEWAAVRVLAQNGANGADAAILDASPAAIAFEATSAGVLKTGQLGKSSKFSFTRGGSDVSASTTWSISGSSGCTASINSSGLVTFSAVSASGYVEVTAINGGTTLVLRLTTTLIKDASPPQTSTQQSASFGGGPSSTSYGSPAAVVTIASNASGQVKCVVSASYEVDNGVTSERRAWTGAFKLAYRLAGGGSWTDFGGGEVVGSEAAIRYTADGDTSIFDVGYANFNQTQSGLTANTPYDIAIFSRQYSNTNGGTCSMSGLATGSAP